MGIFPLAGTWRLVLIDSITLCVISPEVVLFLCFGCFDVNSGLGTPYLTRRAGWVEGHRLEAWSNAGNRDPVRGCRPDGTASTYRWRVAAGSGRCRRPLVSLAGHLANLVPEGRIRICSPVEPWKSTRESPGIKAFVEGSGLPTVGPARNPMRPARLRVQRTRRIVHRLRQTSVDPRGSRATRSPASTRVVDTSAPGTISVRSRRERMTLPPGGWKAP